LASGASESVHRSSGPPPIGLAQSKETYHGSLASVIIGVAVAIVLALSAVFYARSKKPDA